MYRFFIFTTYPYFLNLFNEDISYFPSTRDLYCFITLITKTDKLTHLGISTIRSG